MQFVIDCSTVCSFLLTDEDNLYADKVLIQLKDKQAIAPSIILYEITNVLNMANKRKRCTIEQIKYSIDLFHRLAIQIYHFDNILQMEDVLDLSLKYKVSSYEASYLCLAKKLNLPLATLDKELIKASLVEGLFLKV